MSYSLDTDFMTVAPPRRGAGFAEFQGYFTHYYRGRVAVVRNGKDEVPAYGDLAVKIREKEFVSPLAEDGSFELEGVSEGVHPAEIRYTKGVCKFRLDAKATTTTMTDLGILRCTMP